MMRMKCCAGKALLIPGSLGNGRLNDTERPLRTNRAAAARLAGVMRLIAPTWSSFPQRPQFRRSRMYERTSASVGKARSGMALLRKVGLRLEPRARVQALF